MRGGDRKTPRPFAPIRTSPRDASKAEGAGTLSGLLGWNLRALGLSQAVAKLAGLASMVVLARFLGEVDFGRYTAAVALVHLFVVMIEFGTSGYVVREGAQRPESLGTVLGHVLVLRAALGALTAGVAVPLGIAVGFDSQTLVAVGLFAVGAAFRLVGAAFVSALQALERLGDVARMQAEIALLQGLAAAVTVVAGGRVVAVSTAVLAVSILYPARTWFLLKRRWTGTVTPGVTGLAAMMRVAGFFGISAGLTVGLTFLDSIMVQALKGNAATGLYGAAYRFFLALGVIPIVYTEAASRSIAYLGKRDPRRLERVVGRMLRHLMLVAIPLAAGGAVLARDILETLYGSQYLDASDALRVLLFAVVFVYPSYLTANACFAMGLERKVALTLAIALGLNATLNFFVIPSFGITGAAITTLGAEALVIILHLMFLRGAGIRIRFARSLLTAVGAAGVMVVAIWPLRNLSAIPLAVGVGVYAACLVVLRAFDAEDRAALRSLLGRR